MDFLVWIENTAMATWIRESVSLWAYPGVLSFHTIGLGFLVGTSVAVALRALGFVAAVPIESMARFAVVFWIGFWINALSGFLLLAAYASTTLKNPIFIVKLVFILLAVGAVWLLHRRLFGGRGGKAGVPDLSGGTKALAVSVITLWLGAIVAGRMTAYLDLLKGIFFGAD